MAIKDTLRKFWPWGKSQGSGRGTSNKPTPLREFVYLDEVSLRSLLASQTGGITDEISEAISKAEQAELSAGVGADTIVGKADFRSSFQTTNSSNLQTTRKMIVQSLFKEFHEVANKQLIIKPLTEVKAFESCDAIVQDRESLQSVSDSNLKRGSLLEIEVELKVDAVFQLGTMISEFAGMMKENPEVFTDRGLQKSMADAIPINNILQRMLTGLIPIRCHALNYLVVEIEGQKYVVHRDSVANLDVNVSPLIVVGVTEHLGYWKDIRRVLFSEGQFPLLCRMGRSGIHKDWTPVKLADLFREVAPELADQINMAGQIGMNAATNSLPDMQREAMHKALTHYANLYMSKPEEAVMLSANDSAELSGLTMRLAKFSGTAAEQKSAFTELAMRIEEMTSVKLPDPAEDLSMREESRKAAGLKLVPATESAVAQAPMAPGPANDFLIDVEVIAIYW